MDETKRPEAAAGEEAPLPPGESVGREPGPAEAAEPESAQDFAVMLEAAEGQTPVRWRKGEKLKVTVVRVSGGWVFVSLGAKQEGGIRAEEFTAPPAEEGQPPAAALPAEGDEIEAFVLSSEGGEVLLTTKVSARGASLAALEEAWRSGIPVEGRVAQPVKGGFEVRIAGLRAFCPLSQIDLRWPKEAQEYTGQTFPFRVLEFKEKGRNIIVSRRALLEEERSKAREELKERLVPGAVVTGVVRSIQSFGAFVDLGGVDALIPISEMSWARVESPAEVVSLGQDVTAQVLAVEWERDRVSLSLKALGGDPWDGVAEKYRVGQRVRGTVARLTNFGAFVTLEPGVDGLVHISALGAGRRVKHPKEVLQPGEEVEVEVAGVDAGARKLSLSLEYRHQESLGSLPAPGAVVEGSVEKVVDFGVFVRLPSGHTGLVPNAEMGTPRGTDHSRSFRAEDPMEVVVLDVGEGGRRIRLSRKAVGEGREAQAAQEYRASQPEASGSMGTLGDLFRDKLTRKK
ncbi:MAG: 30S ribosomal protein S1 [Deferrisomatales bacterium]|nr:30S ribosomal protein S1 [Deferrisomatales bacterium]